MDDELRAAIAEARAWAAREGGSMDDLSDFEVFHGINQAAVSMTVATLDILRDHGLKHLAQVLARLMGSAVKTRQ
jgi:hypothetical protein